MNSPLIRAVLALALSLTACAPKQADEQGTATTAPLAAAVTEDLRVEQAQLREGLPGVKDGVLYLTVTNTGETGAQLVSVTTPVAEHVTPMRAHSAAHHDTPVELTIPPGGTLTFEPGADHLMLMNLKRPPRPGETVPVTLTFNPGGEVTLDVPVTPY